jgi:hypothetical protein
MQLNHFLKNNSIYKYAASYYHSAIFCLCSPAMVSIYTPFWTSVNLNHYEVLLSIYEINDP